MAGILTADPSPLFLSPVPVVSLPHLSWDVLWAGGPVTASLVVSRQYLT